MAHLLMVHGNGGANLRFEPFLHIARERGFGDWRVHLPLLPGFEGRALPEGAPGWDPFIGALRKAIAGAEQEPWVVYGHGIGGSMLLEWAARGWEPGWEPQQVILHGCIGAGLERRLFPQLMRPPLIRNLIHRMVYEPVLQSLWEKRLFQQPEAIPVELRREFFNDYRRCAAFPVFFDLITPQWYRGVQQKLQAEPYHLIWGDKERVVAAHQVAWWQRDFPHAQVQIIPGWDHFPMLEQPESFYELLVDLLAING